MERRALLAVVISLLILIGYQKLVIDRLNPPGEKPGRDTAPLEAPLAEPPPPRPEELPPPSAHLAREEPVVRPKGRDIMVETDRYRAVFTTAGARLKSLQLKQYRTAVQADSPPLDLVRQPPDAELPLGVELRGPGDMRVSDAAVVYHVARDHLDVAGDAVAELTFTGEIEGVSITKRVEVRGDRYLLGIDIDTAGVPSGFTEMAITWHAGLAASGGWSAPRSHGKEGVVFDSVVALQGPKLRRHSLGDLEAGTVLADNISWVAFSGQYFLAAILPSAGAENDLRVWMKRFQQAAVSKLLMSPGTFATHLDLYLGPKDIALLEDAGHSLQRAVDLGWFTFVAGPLLQVLRISHRLTGNYGVDIILLTLLIKVLFIPLTKKSLTSMRAMQKLQPDMAAIREKFKDKPEEMNRRIMDLYRQHKVNPLGGCLPMVLQFPVFIGLYQGLLNAVELRHAPFVGWINDLSAPDRLGTIQLPFVEGAGFPMLTLVMGASMFVQQLMTPTVGDPTQQRVMLIMPVVFTFMFINFPSGLTLYWLVNNILTIVQQYTINRPSD